MAGLVYPIFASTPPLSEPQRISIIRALVADIGIARKPLPTDKHGVQISPEGRILNAGQVQQSLNEHGAASRVGDRVGITAIDFKSDRIVFVINGGPHKTHWYDHLQIGLGGGMQPVDQNRQINGPAGSLITLRFAHGVPSLTPAEVKKDLGSLIDWSPPRVAEEMVKPLPAPVKAAIAHHQVLVGMNTDMVEAALGRTGNKIRETDPKSGVRYEDWIYGQPPARTTFVRFVDRRVARVTTYYSDGAKTVETRPDPALAAEAAQNGNRPGFGGLGASGGTASAATQDNNQPPTLRRPGDPAPVQGRGAAPPPYMPPPGVPPGGDLPAPSPNTPGAGNIPSTEPFPGAGMPQ